MLGSLKISHVTTSANQSNVRILTINPTPATLANSVFVKNADNSFGGEVAINTEGIVVIYAKVTLSNNDISFQFVYKT